MSVLSLTRVMLVVSIFMSFLVAVPAASARERESDGAYSPRDSHHHKPGGEHESQFDHEAILGSHKGAEDFDHLPPEEAKRKLLVLAEKMDGNRDGYVDRQELRQWIFRSFRMLSQEDADERFVEHDTDANGFIDWAEYKANEYEDLDEGALKGDGGPLDGDALDELSLLQEDRILFDASDSNQDGKLDKHEHFSFSHPEDDPDKMSPAILKLTKETRDKNGDGKIDFQEFVGERAKDQDKEWLLSEKDRFDKDLDKNGDGALDDPEILAWIVPDNEEIAKEEVDHLFASSDDDLDDKLSMTEIIDHHDIFVGSDATDYGDHLHNLDKFEDEL